MSSVVVTLEGRPAETFLEAVEQLADELDREVAHRGRPGDKLTRTEAVERFARRYLQGDLEPAEAAMWHMGTCDRCGDRSLQLEGGRCPRCL